MTTPTHSHKAWTDKGGHVMITSDKLSLARKVMGTQAFNRARGRKLRDQEGRSDG